MTTPSGSVQYVIPEDPGNPYRLGRKVNHDEKSRNFPYQPRRAVQIQSRPAWETVLPILDQADLGSCVANTGVEWLATTNSVRQYLAEFNLERGITNVVNLTDPVNAEFAITDPKFGLYHLLTNMDTFPGAFPPDDTGSDGTSLGNLFVKMGWLESFEHAFNGLGDILPALMEGPVWFGSNWYSSMFDVDSNGFVSITPDAYVAGGHEVLFDGEVNLQEKWIGVRNHWTPQWGIKGRCRMSFDTVTRLAGEDGDATILRAKVVSPPPFPEPGSTASYTIRLPRAAASEVEYRAKRARKTPEEWLVNRVQVYLDS